MGKIGKILITLFLSAFLVVLVAACGSDSDSNSDSADTAAETTTADSTAEESAGGPFKLGAVLAETGGFGIFDAPFKAGLEIAVEEFNEKGGLLGKYPIELEVKDMQSDPSEAVIRANEIIESEPNALIAPCMTEGAIAVGTVSQEAGIPTISSCATSEELTTSVGDFMFGNYATDAYETMAMAKYAVDQGYKTAFVIKSSDTEYTTNVPNSFKKAFESLGGEIVGEADYSLDQQDFSAIVNQIRNMNPRPDAILVGMFEPAFPAFMRQMKGAGIDIPVLGNQGLDTPTVAALGNLMNSLVYPSQRWPEPGSDLEKFDKKVAQRAGKESVGSYATRGYSVLVNLEAAAEAGGGISPQQIRDGLAQLVEVESIDTTTTYDYEGANGLPVLNPLYVIGFEKGKPVLKAEVRVEPEEIP